jgi:hypothetical protein
VAERSKFVCVAYAGFFIRRHYLLDFYWIERDQRIRAWCASVDEGRLKIDSGELWPADALITLNS